MAGTAPASAFANAVAVLMSWSFLKEYKQRAPVVLAAAPGRPFSGSQPVFKVLDRLFRLHAAFNWWI